MSVAGGGSYVLPEGRARMRIDEMLEAAGWAVQDARAVNLAASRGVAVREFVMRRPHGRAVVVYPVRAFPHRTAPTSEGRIGNGLSGALSRVALSPVRAP